MAYCTQAQIQGEFKNLDISSSTAISDTDVARFIAETDALIDSYLGKKYVVPITGASSLLIVRSIAIYINAARIRKIVEVKSGEDDKNQSPDHGELKIAMKMLNDIVSGDILLSDSDLISSGDGVSSYNYDNDIEALIDVTTDQW